MENHNTSSDNATDTELPDSVRNGYIATAYAHIILVVIPSLLIGPVVLFSLVKVFKKSHTPTTAIFIFITVVCTVAPTTYSFLMDISLITDVSTIGVCGNYIYSAEVLFWAPFVFLTLVLLVATALLAVIQYVVIKYGSSRKIKRTTIFLLVLLPAVTLIASSWVVIADIFETSKRTRGSLCEFTGRGIEFLNALSVLYTVVFTIPPIVMVIVFSILSYRHVKRNTIENANVVKTVLNIMISNTVAAILFRVIPVLNFFIRYGIHSQVVTWGVRYTVELSYPLYLVLIVGIHKNVREIFIGKLQDLKSFVKRPSQVVPSEVN